MRYRSNKEPEHPPTPVQQTTPSGQVSMAELAVRHRRTSQANEMAACWLAATGLTPLVNWAVTILYYAALHHLDAYLTGLCGVQTHSHEEQDWAIQDNEVLRNAGILACYQPLRRESEQSRYRMQNYKQADFKHFYNCYYQPLLDVIEPLCAALRRREQPGANLNQW